MGVLQNFQKFRVRVWKCYRWYRSSEYCGAGVQNSQKFRAGTTSAVPVPWVLWHGTHMTNRSSGYGYEGPTELTEVPGTGIKVLHRTSRSSGYCGTGVQNLQKFRAGIKMLYPYPGYLWYERTELTEVPGTGIFCSVVQNLQKLRVRV